MGGELVDGARDGGGLEGIVREEVLDRRILDLGIKCALLGVIVAPQPDTRDKGEKLPEFHRIDQLVISVDTVVGVILESGALREREVVPAGGGLAVVEEVRALGDGVPGDIEGEFRQALGDIVEIVDLLPVGQFEGEILVPLGEVDGVVGLGIDAVEGGKQIPEHADVA